jgi:hypothetical protein
MYHIWKQTRGTFTANGTAAAPAREHLSREREYTPDTEKDDWGSKSEVWQLSNFPVMKETNSPEGSVQLTQGET